MVDAPVELVVVMSMRALMVDRLRLSTANINIVASQLVKLMMMVVIVNLYYNSWWRLIKGTRETSEVSESLTIMCGLLRVKHE